MSGDITNLTGQELIQTVHPVDAPSAEHTKHAAIELGELIRYLNLVTLWNRADKALPNPGDIDDLIQNLRIAFKRVPQLLGQVAGRLELLSQDEHFATDDPAGPPARERARIAIGDMHALAGVLLEVDDVLAVIGANTSHLKIENPASWTAADDS